MSVDGLSDILPPRLRSDALFIQGDDIHIVRIYDKSTRWMVRRIANIYIVTFSAEQPGMQSRC